MKFPRKVEPHDEELAALVDESLPAARAEQLEAHVSESPSWQNGSRSSDGLALVRGAAVDVEAPARLRARIEEERWREAARGCDRVRSRSPAASQSPPPLRSCSRSRFRAAQEARSRGRSGAARRCRRAAPRRRSPRTRPSSWTKRSGRFRSRTGSRSSAGATGVRTDTVDGRDTVTVFYEKEGRRIGCTIVSGEPLEVPAGADRSGSEGVELDALVLGGRQVVTWSGAD